MGIFPTLFSPIYMDIYTDSRISQIKSSVVLLLWKSVSNLVEIDEWVNENMLGVVFYKEVWPKNTIVWQQEFYFTDIEDAVAFKLRWL